MKKLLLTLLLIIGFVIARDHSSFPGGYIGISLNYGSQQTIGLQISASIVEKSIGKPSLGPYLLPGIVAGLRHSKKNDLSYFYTDAQLLYSAGSVWLGLAQGIAFHEGRKVCRSKLFAGFLTFGGMVEKMPLLKNKTYYKGFHFGVALPIIGTHLYP